MNILMEPQQKEQGRMLFPSSDLSIGWMPVGGSERSGSRLRCYIPCKSLQADRIQSELYRPNARYDAVIFQRRYGPADRSLAASLKTGHCKTILDLCDNDFYNPEGDPVKSEAITGLLEMVERMDLITVSSVELQKVVSGITETPVLVVEEYLDSIGPGLYQTISTAVAGATKKIPGRRTKFVWFGYGQQRNPETGINHLQDILPLLERLNQTFPLALSVISNNRKKYVERVSRVSFPTRYFSWDRLSFNFLLSLHDICLIPIRKDPFTVCKSQNRLITALLH
ncbi:MAG: hypothetical protein ACRD4B_06630, partial [Acidobacteriota bacterium]